MMMMTRDGLPYYVVMGRTVSEKVLQENPRTGRGGGEGNVRVMNG